MAGSGVFSTATRIAAVATMIVVVQSLPAWASSAEAVAQQTAAIQTALKQKHPVDAEVLAQQALELATTAPAADALEIANLNRLLGDALFDQQKFADAEPYYVRALALRRDQLGAMHVDVAVSINDLAIVLKRQEHYNEAMPLYARVVEIRAALFGPNSAEAARARYFLARNTDETGDYAAAASQMAAAVETARVAFGAKDATTIQWIGERAAMLHDAGDIKGAAAAYKEAIAGGEAVLDADDARLASARNGLGKLYEDAGYPDRAVPLLRTALATRDKVVGADDPATFETANTLAHALYDNDQAGEAEGLFRRVLAWREAAFGADSTEAGEVLRWLGDAVSAQNRKAEAEIIFKRVLSISEAKYGPDGVLTAFDLIGLGLLYSGQQRFEEARPMLQRAVAILEPIPDGRRGASAARIALSFLEFATGNTNKAIELGKRSLDDVVALDGAQSGNAADIMLSIAGFYEKSGDLTEVERLTLSARDIYKATDPGGRNLLRADGAVGRLRLAQHRNVEAVALLQQVLDAMTSRYGTDSEEIEPALLDAGVARYATGDYAGAADAFGRATVIAERLASIDAAVAFESRTGAVEDQAIASAAFFDYLVKAQYQLAAATPARATDYAGQAFLTAQRVIESQAAGALAQMAARQASGGGALAGLVRDRQDLVASWQKEDRALTQALAAQADAAELDGLRRSLSDADGKIVAIDAKLKAGFPKFAELQRPAPLSVADVQERLGENDVLLFYADTKRLGAEPAATYLWVVPKSGEARWFKLGRSTGELKAGVQKVRDSMGVGANTRGPTRIAPEGGDKTTEVLTAASELYDALLGEVTGMIAGKSLVIVPSKVLAPLPFQALVSRLPSAGAADRYRDADWLTRDHAITILPSVASLIAPAPAVATASDNRVAYEAFANPLLLGSRGDDRRAYDRSGCAPAATVTAVAEADDLPALTTLFRGASADVAAVRLLPPLPETTDEVCAIGAMLGAGPSGMHLGAGATEAAVKALSADGELARAKVIHFATHGLVSGDLNGLAEPAIVLTPPEAADADDDGLLTASEVATLKLDADWVILSACNTASSDGGGEALSGLARAFFYAGARALLVSHWPVNSEAAVALTTGAMAALAKDPAMGRAAALQQAMVAEIDKGGSHADPANWAPFILVGSSQ